MSKAPAILVIGAGAFGSALASVISSSGDSPVILLGRQEDLIRQFTKTRIHQIALPNITLSNSRVFSTDYKCLREADIVLFAISSKSYKCALDIYSPWLKDGADIVICAKGFEYETGRLLSEYSERILPSHNIAVISGPGFASDIARGLPAAMVLAAESMEKSEYLAHILSSRSFQLYPSDDRIGVQLGGALKNIIAIACGLVKGANFGESACAMIIAQGLKEMSELVKAMGGRVDTVQGLSGLGDLVLTATSKQSRNLRFGILLGRGQQPDISVMGLIEGTFAASLAVKMADRAGVEVPIFKAVSFLVDNRITIQDTLEAMMMNHHSRKCC